MGKHTNGMHGRPGDDGDDVYDALADLFLSDPPAPGAAVGRRARSAAVDDADDTPPAAPARPALHDRRDGPRAPSPVIATIGAPADEDEPAEPMGARLRRASLPAPAPRPAPGADAPRTPEVEALILGHLPVVASAWATQYARVVSEQESRPVAVLRIAGGYVSLDVLGAGGRSEPLADVREAVAAAARLTDRWTIRADAITEPALAESADVGHVTLLVGADEAAIVAAYRTLKGLAAAREARHDDAHPRRLRVSIMGAGGQRADEAFEKIGRAAGVFLGVEIERGPTVERVEPASGMTLFRGPVDGPLETLTGLVAGAVRQAAPVRAAEADGQPGAPAPARRADRPAPEAAREPALASHVAGLRALLARCPYEPRVELAVGDDGRLHVLERATDATLSSLLTATSWAAAHAEVLALTGGAAAAVRPRLAPIMHVFTDRAAPVRRLLDTEVRVHLLSRVDVDGCGAWCCNDLN